MSHHFGFLKGIRLGILIFLHINFVYATQTDVAASKTANQSTTEGTNVASLALDDDPFSCSKTLLTVKGSSASWRVDLGSSHKISSIHINTGSNEIPLEIYVSSDVDQNERLCRSYTPKGATGTIVIPCLEPTTARFIVIRTSKQRPSALSLCNFQAFECDKGFFGEDCSNPCHCTDKAQCDLQTGACPSSCSPGWMGLNCSLFCHEGFFGAKCKHSCHCLYGEPCDREIGSCSSGCDTGWYGNSCQVATPSLTGRLRFVGRTKDSITLRWPTWIGRLDRGMKMEFRLHYSPYKSDGPRIWFAGPAEPLISSKLHQLSRVTNLTTNTFYEFLVVPVLIYNSKVIKGSVLGPEGPFQTACDFPGAPENISARSIVDKEYRPAKLVVSVQWQSPPKSQIHCDNIALFKIFYKSTRSNSWLLVQASNLHRLRNITENIKYGDSYEVKVATVNNRGLETSSNITMVTTLNTVSSLYSHSPFSRSKNDSVPIIAGVIGSLFIILLILILVGYVYRRRSLKYRSLPDREIEEPENLNRMISLRLSVENNRDVSPTDSGVVDGLSSNNITPSSVAAVTVDSSVGDDVSRVHEDTPVNHRVKVDALEEFIARGKENDCEVLKKEYEGISTGFIAPYECGKLPGNKHKNRFVNIIPYDHSRVLLDRVDDDPESDYINANYIEGYNCPKAYIAAQGTNKYTTQDMWKMVWQVNSGRIIMVTNLVENGKRKCEQYWPDIEKTYDNILVKQTSADHTSDFIIRTFTLIKNGEERQVKQFHFTVWPDHGVPTRASPIIAFRRKIRTFDESFPGVLVVHCSAGVGRTGTFMALDYLLDQAKEEGSIDLYSYAQLMRRDRVNMIQTLEQYIFVYDAILEALKAANTLIPSSEFSEQYEKLCLVDPEKNMSPIEEQFNKLQNNSCKFKPSDFTAANLSENACKNRNPQILASDKNRPYLNTHVEGTNDYINAIFLDGFTRRKNIILTQMPTPDTVIDFWRLVHEHHIGSLVMLNPVDKDSEEDEDFGQYWTEDEACECGPFIIEPGPVDTSHKHITVRELKLTFESTPYGSPLLQEFEKPESQSRLVTLFQLECWPVNEPIPASKPAIIVLTELVERSQQKSGNGPVLIHCLDGASQSGLFAAFSSIWEKMKVDQEVDVFTAVKQMKSSRPQLVNNIEQYKFCYEMVLAYLAEFATYANFR